MSLPSFMNPSEDGMTMSEPIFIISAVLGTISAGGIGITLLLIALGKTRN